MATIDYSILPFQVLIGDLDITDCLTKFEISRPIAEQGNILTWTGNFELFFNSNSATITNESQLNPITNPAYFRPYQKQCVITILGFVVCRFYIQNYTFNPYQKTGEASIYQILDIASGDTLSDEVTLNLSINGNPLGLIIEESIKQAFQDSSIAAPSIIFDKAKHTGIFYNRVTGTDFINVAADFAFKNYYWLYVDTLNRIDHVSGDPEKSSNLIIRSLDQVELSPIFDNLNFASDKTIVSGIIETANKDFSFGFSFDVLDPPEDGEEVFDSDGRRLRLITHTYKKRWQVYPELYTNSVLDENGSLDLRINDDTEILYEKKIVEYKYWGINPPYANIETAFDTIPPINPKYFPQVNDFASKWKRGDLVQTITTTYRVSGDTFIENFGDETRVENNNLVFYDKTIETDWVKIRYIAKGIINQSISGRGTNVSKDETPFLWSSEPIRNGRIDPDGTIPESINPKDDENKGSSYKYEEETRPENRQKEPDLKLEEQIVKGEANFQPVGWTPFRKKPFVVDVGFIPSQDHANYLAFQLGRREIRRRDSVSVIMPVPIEYLQDGLRPFRKARIHDLELLITEEIISIENSKMQFAFTGERIGIIPVVESIFDPIPFLPNQSFYLVNQNHFLIENNAYSSQLEIIGGIPPFIFVAGTLPSGLSLSSGGLLSGSSTINGQSSHLINITDSANNIQQFTINFSIIPNTPSIILDNNASDLLELSSINAESIYIFTLELLVSTNAILQELIPLVETLTTNALVETLSPLLSSAASNASLVNVIQVSNTPLNNTLILTPNTIQSNPVITDYGLNNELKISPITIVNYESETTALLARFGGTYNQFRRDAINDFIKGLKDNNLYNTFAALWIRAAETESDALINWISTNFTSIKVGSPTFTQNRGFTGTNANTSYIRLNFIPSTNGGSIFTQNSATFGVYNLTNTADTDNMGVNTSTPSTRAIRLVFSATSITSGLNDDSIPTSQTIPNPTGTISVSRTASNIVRTYRNGALITAGTGTSTGLPTAELFSLSYNNNNESALGGLPHEIAAEWVASGWTQAQNTAFDRLLRTYLAAIGLITIPDWGYFYTASQLSEYSAPLLSATWSNLTDGSGVSGGATNSGTQWIQADLGSTQSVSSVRVGGGTLPAGWGGVASYLNNRLIQYSNDGANWTTAVTITGVTDSGANQFVTFSFASVSARYWRIFTTSGFVATTEFVIKN